MTLGAGTRLGPYEILAPLGAGGMGEVYRAHDTRLDRDVALKVVGGRHGDDPAALRRFAREAKIAARLTHPNVCTLFDAGSEGAVAYFVMELLEGETLGARLARGRLSESEARRIGSDVARGLARAQELGFVHRDLKPQNVFLTSAGAKILDFGLARTAPGADLPDNISVADTASVVTGAGSAVGTVGYMSPEQVRGGPVGPESDVWSFGCVLYEMLSGRRAFAGRNETETLASVLAGTPDWRSLGPEISPNLRNLVARCLEKDPANRPKDVAAAGLVLESGSGLEATLKIRRPASVAPRNARRLRLAAVGSVVAAAGAAGLVLLLRRSAPVESLAVLPFSTSGSDAAIADVCASVSDSVIARISQAPNLRVMASSAVARFAGKNVDPLAAAHELSVRAVLTGRAVGRSSRVTITAELMDARDGRHLWGERYDRPLESIATLPAEIASAVAAKLHLSLSGEDRTRLARRDTESREAYELWLKGRQNWARRSDADLEKALGYFERSLEADPQYARAWSGIAEVWDVFGYTERRPVPDAYEKAKAAARKALALDPDLADAHAVLAHATMLTGDSREAEREFKRALELDGNSLNGLHWYSHLLMNEKRWDESLALSKRLLELDPLGFWNVHLGEHYLAAGDRTRALEQFRRAVELDRNSGPARSGLGRLLLADGRIGEAVPELEAAHRLDPEDGFVRRSLADAYEKAGRPADAARLRAEAGGSKP